jgi:DNA-binding IclR family transcriptional regulator
MYISRAEQTKINSIVGDLRMENKLDELARVAKRLDAQRERKMAFTNYGNEPKYYTKAFASPTVQRRFREIKAVLAPGLQRQFQAEYDRLKHDPRQLQNMLAWYEQQATL